MTDLLLASLALVAGPVLARLLRGRSAALYALDGFVLVSVAGLCLFHILPEAFSGGHAWSLGLAAAGFVLPGWAERTLEQAHRRAHRWILGLALVGLCLHAAMDGAGLGFAPHGHDHAAAQPTPEHLHALDQAILLHRLPTGLVIWMTMVPLFGTTRAWLAIGAMVVSTALGYLAGQSVRPALDSPWLADFLALVAGGLLHVIVHQARPEGTARPRPLWGGVGALLAVASLVWMASDHADLLRTGLLIEWYAAMYWPPVLFGGALSLTVLLRAWARAAATDRKGLFGGLQLGLLTPVCSCGPGPIYEDQVGHGLGRSRAAVAAFSAHTLRPEAWMFLLVFAGWQVTVLWVLASSAAVALLGLFLSRAPLREGALSMHRDHGPGETLRIRPAEGRLDWLHFHAAWFVVGLLVLNWIAGSDAVTAVRAHPGIQLTLAMFLILVASFLEIPLVAAVLMLSWWMALFGGSSVTGASFLGWLIAGPLLGSGLRRTIHRLHGSGTAAFAVFLAWGSAMLAWTAGGAVLDGMPSFFEGVPAQQYMDLLHAVLDRRGAEAAWGPGRILLAALAAGLTGWSLLAVGPRGWLAQVFSADEHAHAHHPGAPHEHTGHHQVQVDVAGEEGG